jgi:ubiquinone/menaquinone biosynthesis C-methylase UbiE
MNSPLKSDSAHWDAVYQQHGNASGKPAGVSWYRPHLERSLHWITQMTAGDTTARIIDVGTGESTLADDLLARGCHALTLLDLSATALGHLRKRLLARHGEVACAGVQWLAGDVTQLALPESGFDVWHDRAVLHFLTAPIQRAAYVAQATRCVRPGGALVVATFAADGPQQCSQLDVMRYSEADLAALFNAGFEAVASEREVHTTPSGAQQAFQYLIARRR